MSRSFATADGVVLIGYAGIQDFNVDLGNQTAVVTAGNDVEYATLLEKIKKTGKTVNSAEMDGVTQAI